MTGSEFAVARWYARTLDPRLKVEIDRYRELEEGPSQGQLFEEPDNLEVAEAVRRVAGDARSRFEAARFNQPCTEQSMLQKALRTPDRKRREEELRASLLAGELERRRVQEAERQAAQLVVRAAGNGGVL